MRKQTVEEKHQMQLAMKKNKTEKMQDLQQEKNVHLLENLLTDMKTAIQRAQQTVRQCHLSFPENNQLQMANEHLNLATRYAELLKTSYHELVLGLPKSTEQQLKQLENELHQGEQTMQMLQANLS